MKVIFIYSFFLILGLILSQFLPLWDSISYSSIQEIIRLASMITLSYIMINVGMEFKLDKTKISSYSKDYLIAATSAAFPWIFCALYFIYLIEGSIPLSWEAWKQPLLISRFASPTSAGILFTMLAAAGLKKTWTYKKIKILAIFDDIDTILFLIPLQFLIIGFKPQLLIIAIIIFVLLKFSWTHLNRLKIPYTCFFLLLYAVGITLGCESIHQLSIIIAKDNAIHLEVLLPAFTLGVLINNSPQHRKIIPSFFERHFSNIISTLFMFIVGLSMPIFINFDSNFNYSIPLVENLGLTTLIFHIVIITLISNLGKMFPLLCYRNEATWKERLAICVAMFPRGEVGAGIIVISLSLGFGGILIPLAILSLILNLLLTSVFIIATKYLIQSSTTHNSQIRQTKLERKISTEVAYE